MIREFKPGVRFTWKDESFEVLRLLPDRKVNIICDATGEASTFELATLVAAQADGLLKTKSVGKLLDLSAVVDWAEIPQKYRDVAEYRLKIIDRLKDLDGAELHAAINTEVEAHKHKNQEAGVKGGRMTTAISKNSVYRWLADYRASGSDPRSLIPKTKKRGTKNASRRIHPEALRISTRVIEDQRHWGPKRTAKFIHREIALQIRDENSENSDADQIPTPSPSTVYRIIRALETDREIIGSYGQRGGYRGSKPSQESGFPGMPLSQVQIDHTPIDLMVLDEETGMVLGRPTLTLMMDIATRMPLGMYLGFEPPSVSSVMQCLRHGILPKPEAELLGTKNPWLAYGVPRELVIDNGKEFIGRDLDEACTALSITLVRSPVKTPQFKAEVERIFRTLNSGILHLLPGTTLSDIKERGDYDSAGKASLTLADLTHVLTIFLIDMYAKDIHSGLHARPADKWLEYQNQGFYPMTYSAEELRRILARVEYRTIQPYGIELHNLIYNSSDLAPLRIRTNRENATKYKIKYDPTDLGSVFVFDPFEERYLEVPAIDQTYAKGKSIWVHEVTKAYQRRMLGAVDPAEFGESQREINTIVENSMIRQKETHKKQARWGEGGGTIAPSPQLHELSRHDEFDDTWQESLNPDDPINPYDVDWDEQARLGVGLSPSITEYPIATEFDESEHEEEQGDGD